MSRQLDLAWGERREPPEPEWARVPDPVTGPLYLVSCVSQKSGAAAPARDLYQSDWFRKARAYVEALGARWMILSAKHGLLEPSKVIEPYDTMLAAQSKRQREVWGCWVVDELLYHVADTGQIVILAGSVYRDAILSSQLFRARGYRAAVPMEGLGIGEQKAWLIRETAEIERQKSQKSAI